MWGGGTEIRGEREEKQGRVVVMQVSCTCMFAYNTVDREIFAIKNFSSMTLTDKNYILILIYKAFSCDKLNYVYNESTKVQNARG